MKINQFKQYILLFLMLAMFITLFAGCNKKLTEAEQEIIAMEEQLKNNPDDVDLVQKLIQSYFSNNMIDKLIDIYEAHEEEFVENPLMICHYGGSLAMKAGSSEKIEDQLKWVKKSMITLDACVQKFPDSHIPYLWRAMTYSYLPSILNARNLVEDDIKLVMDNFKKNIWNLDTGELEMVYTAYLNVAKEYDDTEFYELSYEKLKKDLPDTTLDVYKEYKNFKK